MAKYDKTLDRVWSENPKAFEKVVKATDDLLWTLIQDAVRSGVPRQVAQDTFVDWLRSHMREESFMS